MISPRDQLLWRVRFLIGIVIIGLVLSGVTAFPLLREVDLLYNWIGEHPGAMPAWIRRVHRGLHDTYRAYPFMAYGTDWLAFGHLVIALFFVGAFVDPIHNIWSIRAGQIACVGVIPLAVICGEIRGIPLWWRAIDSAFGVFGFIPLWLSARMIRRMQERNSVPAAKSQSN